MVLIRLARITGTFHEDACTFMMCRSVLLRMRNVGHRNCRENQNTLLRFKNFFFPKIVPFRDNVGKYGTARQATEDDIIWYTHFAFWINKLQTFTQKM